MRASLQKYSSIRKIALTLLVLLAPFIGKAQTFPVEATSIVIPSYSVYYEDYYSAFSSTWQVNLIFKDFNEVSRDVKIIMHMEGDDISISTKANLPNNSPLTLYPGVPLLLTGADLQPYLGFNNIDVTGKTLSEFQFNSRLAEGGYDFCLEVVDYSTGEVLSRTSCNNIWLQLNDEPTIISPLCASVTDPFTPINIIFQWQQTGLLSPNSATTTEYQLAVYEVTDPIIDPVAALGNGQAIRVFQSEWSSITSYLYTIASPALTVGKRYTYSVQARDIGGRDLFKNNGFSEPCWFSYGYGEDGEIVLTTPKDKDGFRKDDFQYFYWEAPDNKMDDQEVEYEFTMKEKNEGQSAEDAMMKNDAWYENLSMPVLHDRGDEHSIDKSAFPMAKGGQYVWKVEAFSGEQRVATSEVYEVAGPPILEYFYVERHKILVTKITNADFDSLAGTGIVKVTADGLMATINFSGLELVNVAGAHFVNSGVIESPLEDELTIMLHPTESRNDTTKLIITDLQLSKDRGFLLKGIMEYVFPLITDNDEAPIVKTAPSWFKNIDFMITGNPKLDKNYSIDLLDPLNFTVNLDAGTEFFVIQNAYDADFYGNVAMPNNVTAALVSGRVQYPFYEQPHLFYMEEERGSDASKIKAVNRTNIVVEPNKYTLDFSDERSPEKFSDDEYWKGLYLDEYNVLFKTIFTSSNSLNFTEEIKRTIVTSKSQNEGWVSSQGAHIYAHVKYSGTAGVLFNTFPASIDTLLLSVHESELKNSYVKGGIQIPIISETKVFKYTVPLALTGFTDGYLEEDLDGMAFTHNQNGGANKMYIDINRAVFVDKQYIEMDIDLEWPEFEVTLNSVAGFCAWGNYDIGFYTPGGVTTLTEQVNGKASGYDITIDFIGAGREQNLYAFGTSANIVMGDDVSGANGPPIMSAYSIVENSLLPDSYTFIPGTEGSIFDVPEGGHATINLDEGTSQNFNLTAGDAQVEGNIVAEAGGTSDDQDDEIGSYLEGESEIDIATDYTLEENKDKTEGLTLDIEDKTTNITYEDVVNLLELIKPFLKEEAQVKIDNVLDKLAYLEDSALAEIYKGLKEDGFNINKLLKSQVDALAKKLTDPIDEKLGALSFKIDSTVVKSVDDVAAKFTDLIEKGIQAVGDGLTQSVNNESAVNIIESTINGAKAAITKEFKRTLQASIKANITDKITVLIDSTINYRLTSFIQEEVKGLGYALIDKNASSINGSEMFDRSQDMLIEMGEELLGEFKKVSMSGVLNTIETTAQEAFDDFDYSRVKAQILDSLEGAVADEVLNLVTDNIDKLLGENSVVGGVAAGVLNNVEFDFDNIGEKVKNGELDQIVSFDLTEIEIKSKIADLKGFVEFKADDPIWGDSWQAELMAVIHKPEFTASAKFLNGKVDDYNYWFLELNIESGLNVPMGPVTLDGVGGKVFHHMLYDPEEYTYKPYEQTKFGAGLNMYLFDPTEINFHINATAEVTILEDYFTIEIRSYVGIKPNDPEEPERPKMGYPFNDKWMATGSGLVAYNSRDKHLLGVFSVKTHTKSICAGGEMGFDIKPDSWNLYVGKKADPLYAHLLCKESMSVNAWFDLSDVGMQLGLEVDLQINAETPFWIKIPGRKFKPYASFGFYFLAEVDLAFKPKLKLKEAIIYLEAHAEIGAKWESTTSDKTGTWVLAGAYLKGLAHYKNTEEESYIKGELAGKITVCNISVGIELEVEKSI
ncbi:MAG: hypothetical protein HRT71_19805 [Flavobacteriales bacterium]|nr:hypothetical protein [Flavobacteriales bacterium]